MGKIFLQFSRISINKAILARFFFCLHFYFERWKKIENVTCCVLCLFHSVSGAGGRGAGKIGTGVVLN